ncbi:hypothetical protein V5O48_016288 [Marasmius crinis-equi]|uniref:Uncharacterized protein n=1 Tax=Marasmius crinis-equi TaxID=585013 RepID=A0ABR3ES49_9AGAR
MSVSFLQASSISDMNRRKVEGNQPAVVGRRRFVIWLMDAELPESYVVEHSVRHLKILENEALETGYWILVFFELVTDVYRAKGDVEGAIPFLRQAELLRRARSGGEEEALDDLVKTLLKHPRWNWKKRAQGLMKQFL